MGTTSLAGDARITHDRRRVDVTDLQAERVAAYVRRQGEAECYLERRGTRTYLVAPN